MKRFRLRARGAIPLLCLLAYLSISSLALAQQSVGIVTALRGKAQLTRAGAQTALRFKDDLNLRDVIDTQEKSLTRVLFGGKSTVTVRELSRLEVREELLPGGTTRTVHDLSSGSILVNVARSLMRRGDEVQIRTPNAIAAVRGSAIFALYNAVLAQSVFVLLTGSAIVTPQGQPSITLTPNTSVNVTGSSSTGVQAGSVGTVTQAEANGIVEGSEVGTGGVTEESAEAGVQEAAQLSEAVVVAVAEPVVTTIAESPPQTAIEEGNTPVVDSTSEEPAPSSGGGTVSKTLESESVQTAILETGGTLPAAIEVSLPFIFGADTTSSRSPFFQLSNETLSVSDRLILVKSGANVTLAGKLLDVTSSTLTVGSAALSRRAILLLQGSGTSLSGTGTDPLITVNPSTLTFGRFLNVVGGASISLAGPLLSDSASTFTAERDFVAIRQLNSKLTGTGTTPLLQFSSSTLNVGTMGIGTTGGDVGDFFRVDNNVSTDATGPASVTLAGPLLSDTGSTFDILLRYLRVVDGSTFTSTTSDSLMSLSGSTVNTGLDFTRLDDSSTVSLSGPLIDALSTTKITVGTRTSNADFLDIRNSGTVFTGPSKPATGDASPLITFDQSTLTTTVPITSASTHFLDLRLSGKLTLGGPFLKATSSTFTTNSDFTRISQLATLTSTGTTAHFQFTNSTFNVGSDTTQTNGSEPGDNFFRVDDRSGSPTVITGGATVTLAGPLMSDSGSTFTVADNFLRVRGSTFTSTTTSPLITLSGSTLSVSNDFAFIDESALVTLSGSLLSAGSTLTISDDLLDVQTSGQLVMNSADPVVLLNGGTHTIGDLLFEVSGSSTSDQPIKGSEASFTVNSTTASNPIGALFKATNAADISVDNGIKIDTALFEATLPAIELVGTSSAQTKITSANTFAEISGGKVLVKGPFISLDKGLITVTSGPLISVSSTMDVSGDLLKLIGGSTISVVNGPLIKVTGSGSALNVTGALANFGTATGNNSTLIIRNNLCSSSCSSAHGVNFITQSNGSVSISGTPIANSRNGSIDARSTDAVIQASDSGSVTIQGN